MLSIVDYGVGNLRSVVNAFDHIGVKSIIVNEPSQLKTANHIVLPGVGSFRIAMERLRKKGFDDAIQENVIHRETPILGICLGMQLLGKYSTEDGNTEGLGLINGTVERFSFNVATTANNLKIPHVGFNNISFNKLSRLFKGFSGEIDFYFTHSYRMICSEKTHVAGECFHGERFVAAVEKGHITGTQFHPEKSQSNGLKLLTNFADY